MSTQSTGASLSTTLKKHRNLSWRDYLNLNLLKLSSSNSSKGQKVHSIGKATSKPTAPINSLESNNLLKITLILGKELGQQNKQSIIAQKMIPESLALGNLENLQWVLQIKDKVHAQISKQLCTQCQQHVHSWTLLDPTHLCVLNTLEGFNLRIVTSRHLKQRQFQMYGFSTGQPVLVKPDWP